MWQTKYALTIRSYKFGCGNWFSAVQWRRFPYLASVVCAQLDVGMKLNLQLQSYKFPGPCGEYSSSIVAWPPTCSWWTWFSCVCGIVFHFTMLSKEELHTRTIQNWISTTAALLSCSLDSAAAKQVKECLKSAHFVSVSLEILINCVILM